MPYVTGADLCQDVLFRAGEPPDVSDWNTKVLDYVNRAYQGIVNGASEFLPEYIDDWWWMRASAVLLLEPTYEGVCEVTQDSVNVTLSAVSPGSLAGYRFRIEGQSDVPLVATHTAGTAVLTFDSAYTGPTNTAVRFIAMKTTYNLSSSVAAILSPVISFRENPQIMGVSPERMDTLFPLQGLRPGVPQMFSLENDRVVRFSHGGRRDGFKMRMEYRYRPVAAALTNSIGSIPLVPGHFRHIIADAALTYLHLDKNDDRAASSMSGAKSGLAAMVKENRRRLSKMDQTVGMIKPRQGQVRRGVLRTDSGFIIG